MTDRAAQVVIILLLLLVYLLQGVVIGFIFAVPLYLDSRGAKWKEQGTFNFVAYPFSMKLAWAPIIDAVYLSRIGRRKTWLVPIQVLIGVSLYLLSFRLSALIDQLDIKSLTWIFFFVYILLSGQDICVDGWALTLLANFNLQWASTCQTVGQTLGRFIGFTVLLTLQSATFSNRYVRKPLGLPERPDGLFTLDQFVRFWAMAFLAMSAGIALFRKDDHQSNHLSLKQTYLSVFQLLKKKCVRQLALLFLVSPIGYTATYAMTNLVLKQYGVPNETIGLLGIPLIVVKTIIPFCVTHTRRPLTWYSRAYLPRLAMGVLIAIFICFTPRILQTWYFYPVLICLFMANEALIYLMLVSRVGFCARVSDPSIGGTYITMLSMLANLGASVTSSIVLYAAEWIKPKTLAYPVLVGVCSVLGCIWLFLQYRTMVRLQSLPVHKWHLLDITTESETSHEEVSERCLNVQE